MTHPIAKAACYCLALLLLLGGCEDTSTPASETIGDVLTESATHTNDDFVGAGQNAIDALASSIGQLKVAIDDFLSNTTPAKLQTLQQQWIDTHKHWHHAALYLQLGEQSADMASVLVNSCRGIHQQQLQAGYIDSIENYPDSGLVNDINLPMTATILREQHQRYDVSEVSTGLNVLEFELWYRQLEDFDPNISPSQAQRSQGIRKNQLPQQRRRALLALLGELLLEDVQQLQQAWPMTVERIISQGQLPYRQLTIAELQFLLASMTEAHTPFSHENSWQLNLLENVRSHAGRWSDQGIVQQLDKIADTLEIAVANNDFTLAQQQLAELLIELQTASTPVSSG